MRFLLNTAGDFFARLVLSSSNQFKPTSLGPSRYLHTMRAKNQDMGKGKELRAERGMGKGDRDMTHTYLHLN